MPLFGQSQREPASPWTEGPSALDRVSPDHPGVTQPRKFWTFMVPVLFVASRVVLADPTGAPVPPSCPVSDREQARPLADRLDGQGDYQHAGACYLVSGDYDRANRAFIQASRVSAAAGSRQFADGRDQAKAQWRLLQSSR